MSILHGVDIHAQYQAGFKASDVPNVDFVITKTTGGTNFIISNWQGMLDGANLTGVYHYARERGYAGTAEQEAYNFINQANYAPTNTNRFLEWEESKNNNLGDVSWVLEWMRIVKSELGKTPILYTYHAVLNANPVLSQVRDAGYPLWYARYPYSKAVGWQNYEQPDAPNWGKPVMWQYSSAGMIPGWQKALDLNIFYGSSEDWLSLAKTETSAKTVDIVPNAIFVDTNNDTYKANLLFGTYTKTDNNENAIKIEDKSILGVENK